jgi:UrcA family protein
VTTGRLPAVGFLTVVWRPVGILPAIGRRHILSGAGARESHLPATAIFAGQQPKEFAMKQIGKIAVMTICAGLLGGVAAHAGTVPEGGMRISVAYDDLNVSHPAGARILLARIEEAASVVCGGAPETSDLKMQMFYRTCAQEATARAVSAVGQPLVAALYGRPMQRVAARH